MHKQFFNNENMRNCEAGTHASMLSFRLVSIRAGDGMGAASKDSTSTTSRVRQDCTARGAGWEAGVKVHLPSGSRQALIRMAVASGAGAWEPVGKTRSCTFEPSCTVINTVVSKARDTNSDMPAQGSVHAWMRVLGSLSCAALVLKQRATGSSTAQASADTAHSVQCCVRRFGVSAP